MRMKISLLLLVIISLNACLQSSKEERTTLGLSQTSTDPGVSELIQTVLNLPGVIRLSKSNFIQEKYGMITVFFDENTLKPNDSLFYQNGSELKVQEEEPSDAPCYVFKKISIQGDTAYVLLNLDATGFTCHGSLNYVNGKWVPDNDFKIGYG